MPAPTLPRPVYAVAGAGDLAAEQLKKLAAQAPELQARAAEFPQELRRLAAEFPRDLQNFAADLPSYAAQLQAKARDLHVDDVTAAVRKNVENVQHRAVDVYDELVERGQKVVAQRQDGAGEATTVATPDTVKKPTVVKKTVAKKTPAKPAAE